MASPHVFGGTQPTDSSSLDHIIRPSCAIESPSLHLDVTLRSYKAEAVSEFVTALLLRDPIRASEAYRSCAEFPLVMTRKLSVAQAWLRRKQRGSRRVGIVASSGGRRLRAHGLDVRAELDVENWFLNPPDDVRSSHYLETPATEFGIQGLELDWTAVCWDLDLQPSAESWRIQAFKGTRWEEVHDLRRRRYVVNKYRVLLTRAREGMILWVPEGEESDHTRPPRCYDRIANFLTECGIPELSR